MASVKLLVHRTKLGAARTSRSWNVVDEHAENAIALNPWDAEMFAHLAESATNTNRGELAIYAWTSALKIDDTRPHWFRKFGGALQAEGKLEMAKNCFEKMLALDPTSRTASELLQNLDIRMHMEKNRFATATDARDVEDGGLRQKQNLSPEEEKLADFQTQAEDHAQRAEFKESHDAYRQALAIAPDDRTLRVAMENVELAWLRQRILHARKNARQHPGSEPHLKTISDLETELTGRGIHVFSERLRENPDDVMNLVRMADFYRQVAELDKAAALYEKLLEHPQLAVEARLGIGECYIRSGEAERSRSYLDAALPMVDRQANPRTFKLAHYWMGRYFETRREYEFAVNHYNQITALEPGFRDLKHRLEILFTITWP